MFFILLFTIQLLACLFVMNGTKIEIIYRTDKSYLRNNREWKDNKTEWHNHCVTPFCLIIEM